MYICIIYRYNMYIYIYIYIYINCTVNIWLTEKSERKALSEKSVFQLVSTVAVFKGIYSHLKIISGYRRFYLTSCLEIRHNGVAFS